MSDDDLICICMTVSRGEIKAAVKSGNDTLDGLKSALCCCTGCGTCESRVRKVIEETKEEMASATAQKAG
ncbi:MAG: (2Fe-2S)-binding protein [Bdellovibrionota bacterium]